MGREDEAEGNETFDWKDEENRAAGRSMRRV